MTNRTSLLVPLLGMSLFAGAAMAQAQNQQNQTIPSTSPTQSQSQPMQQQPAPSSSSSTAPTQATQNQNPANGTAPSSTGGNGATYNTSQGQVVINSTVPPAPSTASPPSFEQLSGGKKYISKDDANAYPPLANDFLYVSHNANRISRAQYERWVKHLN